MDALREHGTRASGRIAAAEPLAAIASTLRSEMADELVIAASADQPSGPLDHRLAERAATRFGLPTAHVVAEDPAAAPRDPLLAAA